MAADHTSTDDEGEALVRIEIRDIHAGEHQLRRYLEHVVARLQDEFGPAVHAEILVSPNAGAPGVYLDGTRLSRSCPDPRVFRLAVARALAEELMVREAARQAAVELGDRGCRSECWQDGLLEWLLRGDEPPQV